MSSNEDDNESFTILNPLEISDNNSEEKSNFSFKMNSCQRVAETQKLKNPPQTQQKSGTESSHTVTKQQNQNNSYASTRKDFNEDPADQNAQSDTVLLNWQLQDQNMKLQSTLENINVFQEKPAKNLKNQGSLHDKLIVHQEGLVEDVEGQGDDNTSGCHVMSVQDNESKGGIPHNTIPGHSWENGEDNTKMLDGIVGNQAQGMPAYYLEQTSKQLHAPGNRLHASNETNVHVDGSNDCAFSNFVYNITQEIKQDQIVFPTESPKEQYIYKQQYLNMNYTLQQNKNCLCVKNEPHIIGSNHNEQSEGLAASVLSAGCMSQTYQQPDLQNECRPIPIPQNQETVENLVSYEKFASKAHKEKQKLTGENDALKEEMSKKEEELSKMQERYDRLLEQSQSTGCSKNKCAAREFKEKLKNASGYISQLEKKIKHLKRERTDLGEQNELKNQKIKELEENVEKERNQILTLKALLEESTNNIGKLEATNNYTTTQLNNREEKLKIIQSENSCLVEENNNLNSVNDECLKKVTKLQSDIDSKTSQLNRFEEINTNNEEKINSLNCECEKLNNLLEILKNNVSSKSCEIEKFTQNVKSKETWIEQQNHQLQLLRSKALEYKKAYEDLLKTAKEMKFHYEDQLLKSCKIIKDTQKTLEANEEHHENKMKELESKTDALNRNWAEKERKYSSEVGKLKDQINAANNMKVQYESQILKNYEINKDIQEKQEANEAHQKNKINELESKVNVLNRNREEKEKSHRSLKKQLEDQIEENKLHKLQFTNDEAKLKNELSESRENLQKYIDHLEQAKKVNCELKMQVENMNKRHVAGHFSAHDLRQTVGHLNSQRSVGAWQEPIAGQQEWPHGRQWQQQQHPDWQQAMQQHLAAQQYLAAQQHLAAHQQHLATQQQREADWPPLEGQETNQQL